jgi:hypothetical protein
MDALSRSNIEWPEQTVDEPSSEDMEAMIFEGQGIPATDGCWVWYDEVCEHGHPAWTLRLGYDPELYGITK